MEWVTQIFLLLLRLGIGTSKASDDESKELLSLSMGQWQNIMILAGRQGVAAIVFDGVQRLFDVYGQKIKAAKETPEEWLQWVAECTGMMTQYEQASQHQRKVITELARIWTSEGIPMMVFKGQANASFYPNPTHRATGDIDCWLFGEAKKGDNIMEKHGAVVDFDWYRHSKILFQGETIENHRVMGHTRGNEKLKDMEEELKAMINNPSDLPSIEGCGKVLLPTAQFNACFLTYHGLHHFTSEGLRMKQILDWAMFMKKEQKKVNWFRFNDFCVYYKFDRFASVMNFIAVNYLGIAFVADGITTDGTYVMKVLHSTLYDDDYLFSSGKSDWTIRWLLVKKMLTHDRWKYRDVAQQNVWKHLWQNMKGFLSKNED